MPSPGQLLPIALQLGEQQTDRFVRATIRDSQDNQITGSPFSLSHKGLGAYGINTVMMPDKDFVRVTYEVFLDAGFNTPDLRYPAIGGCFIREDLTAAVQSLNANIQSDATGFVEDADDPVEGLVKDDNLIEASVQDLDAVEATVFDEDTRFGSVEQQTILEGEVDQ